MTQVEAEQPKNIQKFKQVERKSCSSYKEAVEVAAVRGADLGILGPDMKSKDGENHKIRIRLMPDGSFDVITYNRLTTKKEK